MQNAAKLAAGAHRGRIAKHMMEKRIIMYMSHVTHVTHVFLKIERPQRDKDRKRESEGESMAKRMIMYMSHVTHVMAKRIIMYMSYVTHVNESCHTCGRGRKHGKAYDDTHVHMCDMTHIHDDTLCHHMCDTHIYEYMSHVTHVMAKRIIMYMSHVTHVDESCHTYG